MQAHSLRHQEFCIPQEHIPNCHKQCKNLKIQYTGKPFWSPTGRQFPSQVINTPGWREPQIPPPFKLHRYVLPQKVWFLSYFGLRMGIDLTILVSNWVCFARLSQIRYRFLPFCLKKGDIFKGQVWNWVVEPRKKCVG